MTHEEIHDWLADEANQRLFKPTNSSPTQTQREEVFAIANYLDTSQTHKITGCGRCYYNALRAIEKALDIF